LIGVLLAAFVAADAETVIESGRRLDRVGFAQRNPVSKKEILLIVEFVIFAEYYPEILAFVAHSVLQGSPPNAWERLFGYSGQHSLWALSK
jgi:hypothetical protein